jgi:hypothetical protein
MAFQGNAFQGNAFQIPRTTLIATFKNIFRPMFESRALNSEAETRAVVVDDDNRALAVDAEGRICQPAREDRTAEIEG